MEHSQNAKTLIKQQQDAFYYASMMKDGDFMAGNLHEEFVFTSPRAVVLTKQSYTSDFVLNPAVQLDMFESVEEDIAVVGTTAVSTGLVHARFKGKDLLKARATMTFVYHESNWQLLSMQETFIV